MPKKIKYQERKKLGLCVDCSEKAAENKVYCEKCRVRHLNDNKNKKQFLLNQGFCTSCAKPREDPTKHHCLDCVAKHNKYMTNRRQTYIENKKCIDCGAASKYRRCNKCHCKMISTNIFKATTKYKDILELFEKQQGKCAYTGRLLILQESELDHIIPRASGGTNTIDNLQWLHRDVNKMKHDLTEQNFIQTITEIIQYKSKSRGLSL